MSVEIICCGAATLDTIFRVDRLPDGPGKILPTAMVEVAHGMATSAAAAITRLGGRARLFSRVGDDEGGKRFLNSLMAAGVEVSGVRRAPGARTPVATVLVDPEGERLVVPFYDPNLGADPAWLPLDRLRSADAALVDVRWPEGAAVVLDAAREAGKPAVLDGDVGPSRVTLALAARASHSVFSEPAALAASGAGDVLAALLWLGEQVPGFVAVTAGSEGCLWLDRRAGRVRQRRPPAVVAVDTLAAGDVFHGAFVLALAEGLHEQDAVDFANAAAALKCRTFGGRLGAPSREEVMVALGWS